MLVIFWPFIPFFPPNIIVFLILYFTLKKKLEENDTLSKYKWVVFFCVYYLITILIWLTMCQIASNFSTGPLAIIYKFC